MQRSSNYIFTLQYIVFIVTSSRPQHSSNFLMFAKPISYFFKTRTFWPTEMRLLKRSELNYINAVMLEVIQSNWGLEMRAVSLGIFAVIWRLPQEGGKTSEQDYRFNAFHKLPENKVPGTSRATSRSTSRLLFNCGTNDELKNEQPKYSAIQN